MTSDNKHFRDYLDIVAAFEAYHAAALPLCAAETSMSPFCKAPLDSAFQERYINGSVMLHDSRGDFIGSDKIFPLYRKTNELCRQLFGTYYADPRPLSGMNATTTVLLSLLDHGDEILLLTPPAGGHDSFPPILERLGILATEMPFDYARKQPDIDEINTHLEGGRYKALLLPPSDILAYPALDQLRLPPDTILIYDATQTLGFIAAGMAPNPLDQQDKCVVVGGTHKTLPGPTSGLILAKNEAISEKLDSRVSPIYIRNPQPHQIASLLLTLIEFSEFGRDYMEQTVANANRLAQLLVVRDTEVLKPDFFDEGVWSETHQLFLHYPDDQARTVERNAIKHGVTLNRKEKKIFEHSGIRLGLQEITRFGWTEKDMEQVADIMCLLTHPETSTEEVQDMFSDLPPKKSLAFSFLPSELQTS